MKIMGYYQDKHDELDVTESVFVAIEKARNGRVEIYAPIGQHSEADEDYVKDCKKITKEQYKAASKSYYTPEDYL